MGNAVGKAGKLATAAQVCGAMAGRIGVFSGCSDQIYERICAENRQIDRLAVTAGSPLCPFSGFLA
jgi:hypothetical protein